MKRRPSDRDRKKPLFSEERKNELQMYDILTVRTRFISQFSEPNKKISIATNKKLHSVKNIV